MKIEEYLQSLPQEIMSGDQVQLPDHSFREIFDFVNLNENDVFYHLGCGNGRGIEIALEEYKIKKAIGIDIDENKIKTAIESSKEKKLSSEFLCQDIQESDFNDATVILFWFTDEKIIENMTEKFQNLNKGCKIITIWNPLPSYMPDSVEFPYIQTQTPFKEAKNLQEQLLAVFGVKCIDFVTAWEHAERYTKAIGSEEAGNDRFLTIIQSLVIWINAKNLGVACGDEMPESIKTYISILRTFFNIEVEHLLEK